MDRYNSRGVLVSQDSGSGSASRTYDAWLNWTEFTDANGNTTHYTFDRMGRPTRVEDPLGNVTLMTYDDRRRLTHGAHIVVITGASYRAKGPRPEEQEVSTDPLNPV